MTKNPKGGSTASLADKLHTQDEGKQEKNTELLDHPSYIELQEKLTAAEEKANQYWERMLRMQAESENMQRRVERDIANAHKYGLEKFVNELLPVIDSLERAVTVIEKDSHSNQLLEGVNLTLKMFYTAIDKFAVQQIDPIGKAFNPEWHQAVSTQPDPSVQPGTVVEVLQKGYTLNNRLIRPALVVVAK